MGDSGLKRKTSNTKTSTTICGRTRINKPTTNTSKMRCSFQARNVDRGNPTIGCERRLNKCMGKTSHPNSFHLNSSHLDSSSPASRNCKLVTFWSRKSYTRDIIQDENSTLCQVLLDTKRDRSKKLGDVLEPDYCRNTAPSHRHNYCHSDYAHRKSRRPYGLSVNNGNTALRNISQESNLQTTLQTDGRIKQDNAKCHSRQYDHHGRPECSRYIGTITGGYMSPFKDKFQRTDRLNKLGRNGDLAVCKTTDRRQVNREKKKGKIEVSKNNATDRKTNLEHINGRTASGLKVMEDTHQLEKKPAKSVTPTSTKVNSTSVSSTRGNPRCPRKSESSKLPVRSERGEVRGAVQNKATGGGKSPLSSARRENCQMLKGTTKYNDLSSNKITVIDDINRPHRIEAKRLTETRDSESNKFGCDGSIGIPELWNRRQFPSQLDQPGDGGGESLCTPDEAHSAHDSFNHSAPVADDTLRHRYSADVPLRRDSIDGIVINCDEKYANGKDKNLKGVKSESVIAVGAGWECTDVLISEFSDALHSKQLGRCGAAQAAERLVGEYSKSNNSPLLATKEIHCLMSNSTAEFSDISACFIGPRVTHLNVADKVFDNSSAHSTKTGYTNTSHKPIRLNDSEQFDKNSRTKISKRKEVGVRMLHEKDEKNVYAETRCETLCGQNNPVMKDEKNSHLETRRENVCSKNKEPIMKDEKNVHTEYGKNKKPVMKDSLESGVTSNGYPSDIAHAVNSRSTPGNTLTENRRNTEEKTKSASECKFSDRTLYEKTGSLQVPDKRGVLSMLSLSENNLAISKNNVLERSTVSRRVAGATAAKPGIQGDAQGENILEVNEVNFEGLEQKRNCRVDDKNNISMKCDLFPDQLHENANLPISLCHDARHSPGHSKLTSHDQSNSMESSTDISKIESFIKTGLKTKTVKNTNRTESKELSSPESSKSVTMSPPIGRRYDDTSKSVVMSPPLTRKLDEIQSRLQRPTISSSIRNSPEMAKKYRDDVYMQTSPTVSHSPRVTSPLAERKAKGTSPSGSHNGTRTAKIISPLAVRKKRTSSPSGSRARSRSPGMMSPLIDRKVRSTSKSLAGVSSSHKKSKSTAGGHSGLLKEKAKSSMNRRDSDASKSSTSSTDCYGGTNSTTNKPQQSFISYNKQTKIPRNQSVPKQREASLNQLPSQSDVKNKNCSQIGKIGQISKYTKKTKEKQDKLEEKPNHDGDKIKQTALGNMMNQSSSQSDIIRLLPRSDTTPIHRDLLKEDSNQLTTMKEKEKKMIPAASGKLSRNTASQSTMSTITRTDTATKKQHKLKSTTSSTTSTTSKVKKPISASQPHGNQRNLLDKPKRQTNLIRSVSSGSDQPSVNSPRSSIDSNSSIGECSTSSKSLIINVGNSHSSLPIHQTEPGLRKSHSSSVDVVSNTVRGSVPTNRKITDSTRDKVCSNKSKETRVFVCKTKTASSIRSSSCSPRSSIGSTSDRESVGTNKPHKNKDGRVPLSRTNTPGSIRSVSDSPRSSVCSSDQESVSTNTNNQYKTKAGVLPLRRTTTPLDIKSMSNSPRSSVCSDRDSIKSCSSTTSTSLTRQSSKTLKKISSVSKGSRIPSAALSSKALKTSNNNGSVRSTEKLKKSGLPRQIGMVNISLKGLAEGAKFIPKNQGTNLKSSENLKTNDAKLSEKSHVIKPTLKEKHSKENINKKRKEMTVGVNNEMSSDAKQTCKGDVSQSNVYNDEKIPSTESSDNSIKKTSCDKSVTKMDSCDDKLTTKTESSGDAFIEKEECDDEKTESSSDNQTEQTDNKLTPSTFNISDNKQNEFVQCEITEQNGKLREQNCQCSVNVVCKSCIKEAELNGDTAETRVSKSLSKSNMGALAKSNVQLAKSNVVKIKKTVSKSRIVKTENVVSKNSVENSETGASKSSIVKTDTSVSKFNTEKLENSVSKSNTINTEIGVSKSRTDKSKHSVCKSSIVKSETDVSNSSVDKIENSVAKLNTVKTNIFISKSTNNDKSESSVSKSVNDQQESLVSLSSISKTKNEFSKSSNDVCDEQSDEATKSAKRAETPEVEQLKIGSDLTSAERVIVSSVVPKFVKTNSVSRVSTKVKKVSHLQKPGFMHKQTALCDQRKNAIKDGKLLVQKAKNKNSQVQLKSVKLNKSVHPSKKATCDKVAHSKDALSTVKTAHDEDNMTACIENSIITVTSSPDNCNLINVTENVTSSPDNCNLIPVTENVTSSPDSCNLAPVSENVTSSPDSCNLIPVTENVTISLDSCNLIPVTKNVTGSPDDHNVIPVKDNSITTVTSAENSLLTATDNCNLITVSENIITAVATLPKNSTLITASDNGKEVNQILKNATRTLNDENEEIMVRVGTDERQDFSTTTSDCTDYPVNPPDHNTDGSDLTSVGSRVGVERIRQLVGAEDKTIKTVSVCSEIYEPEYFPSEFKMASHRPERSAENASLLNVLCGCDKTGDWEPCFDKNDSSTINTTPHICRGPALEGFEKPAGFQIPRYPDASSIGETSSESFNVSIQNLGSDGMEETKVKEIKCTRPENEGKVRNIETVARSDYKEVLNVRVNRVEIVVSDRAGDAKPQHTSAKPDTPCAAKTEANLSGNGKQEIAESKTWGGKSCSFIKSTSCQLLANDISGEIKAIENICVGETHQRRDARVLRMNENLDASVMDCEMDRYSTMVEGRSRHSHRETKVVFDDDKLSCNQRVSFALANEQFEEMPFRTETKFMSYSRDRNDGLFHEYFPMSLSHETCADTARHNTDSNVDIPQIKSIHNSENPASPQETEIILFPKPIVEQSVLNKECGNTSRTVLDSNVSMNFEEVLSPTVIKPRLFEQSHKKIVPPVAPKPAKKYGQAKQIKYSVSKFETKKETEIMKETVTKETITKEVVIKERVHTYKPVHKSEFLKEPSVRKSFEARMQSKSIPQSSSLDSYRHSGQRETRDSVGTVNNSSYEVCKVLKLSNKTEQKSHIVTSNKQHSKRTELVSKRNNAVEIVNNVSETFSPTEQTSNQNINVPIEIVNSDNETCNPIGQTSNQNINVPIEIVNSDNETCNPIGEMSNRNNNVPTEIVSSDTEACSPKTTDENGVLMELGHEVIGEIAECENETNSIYSSESPETVLNSAKECITLNDTQIETPYSSTETKTETFQDPLNNIRNNRTENSFDGDDAPNDTCQADDIVDGFSRQLVMTVKQTAPSTDSPPIQDSSVSRRSEKPPPVTDPIQTVSHQTDKPPPVTDPIQTVSKPGLKRSLGTSSLFRWQTVKQKLLRKAEELRKEENKSKVASLVNIKEAVEDYSEKLGKLNCKAEQTKETERCIESRRQISESRRVAEIKTNLTRKLSVTEATAELSSPTPQRRYQWKCEEGGIWKKVFLGEDGTMDGYTETCFQNPGEECDMEVSERRFQHHDTETFILSDDRCPVQEMTKSRRGDIEQDKHNDQSQPAKQRQCEDDIPSESCAFTNGHILETVQTEDGFAFKTCVPTNNEILETLQNEDGFLCKPSVLTSGEMLESLHTGSNFAYKTTSKIETSSIEADLSDKTPQSKDEITDETGVTNDKILETLQNKDDFSLETCVTKYGEILQTQDNITCETDEIVETLQESIVFKTNSSLENVLSSTDNYCGCVDQSFDLIKEHAHFERNPTDNLNVLENSEQRCFDITTLEGEGSSNVEDHGFDITKEHVPNEMGEENIGDTLSLQTTPNGVYQVTTVEHLEIDNSDKCVDLLTAEHKYSQNGDSEGYTIKTKQTMTSCENNFIPENNYHILSNSTVDLATATENRNDFSESNHTRANELARANCESVSLFTKEADVNSTEDRSDQSSAGSDDSENAWARSELVVHEGSSAEDIVIHDDIVIYNNGDGLVAKQHKQTDLAICGKHIHDNENIHDSYQNQIPHRCHDDDGVNLFNADDDVTGYDTSHTDNGSKCGDENLVWHHEERTTAEDGSVKLTRVSASGIPDGTDLITSDKVSLENFENEQDQVSVCLPPAESSMVTADVRHASLDNLTEAIRIVLSTGQLRNGVGWNDDGDAGADGLTDCEHPVLDCRTSVPANPVVDVITDDEIGAAENHHDDFKTRVEKQNVDQVVTFFFGDDQPEEKVNQTGICDQRTSEQGKDTAICVDQQTLNLRYKDTFTPSVKDTAIFIDQQTLNLRYKDTSYPSDKDTATYVDQQTLNLRYKDTFYPSDKDTVKRSKDTFTRSKDIFTQRDKDTVTGVKNIFTQSDKDTVAQRVKDTVVQRVKDTVVQSVKDTVVQSDKDTVAQRVKEFVAQREKDTVVQREKDTVAQRDKDTVSQRDKNNVALRDSDTVAQRVKDTVVQRDNDSFIHWDKDTIMQWNKNTVTQRDTDTVTQRDSTVAQRVQVTISHCEVEDTISPTEDSQIGSMSAEKGFRLHGLSSPEYPQTTTDYTAWGQAGDVYQGRKAFWEKTSDELLTEISELEESYDSLNETLTSRQQDVSSSPAKSETGISTLPHRARRKKYSRRSLSLPTGALSYSDVKVTYIDGHFVAGPTSRDGQTESIDDVKSESLSAISQESVCEQEDICADVTLTSERAMREEILSLIDRHLLDSDVFLDNALDWGCNHTDSVSSTQKILVPASSTLPRRTGRDGDGQRPVSVNEVNLWKNSFADDKDENCDSCLQRNDSFKEAYKDRNLLHGSHSSLSSSRLSISDDGQREKSRSKSPNFFKRMLSKRKSFSEKSQSKSKNDVSVMKDASASRRMSLKSLFRRKGSSQSVKSSYDEPDSPPIAAFLNDDDIGSIRSVPNSPYISHIHRNATDTQLSYTHSNVTDSQICLQGTRSRKNSDDHLAVNLTQTAARSSTRPDVPRRRKSSSGSGKHVMSDRGSGDFSPCDWDLSSEETSRSLSPLSTVSVLNSEVDTTLVASPTGSDVNIRVLAARNMSPHDMEVHSGKIGGDISASHSSDSGIQHDVVLQSSIESLKASPDASTPLTTIVKLRKSPSPNQERPKSDITASPDASTPLTTIVKLRKSPSPNQERPKSDITVRWADLLEQVQEPNVAYRKESGRLRRRPRPKSDLGGSSLLSETMKAFGGSSGNLRLSESLRSLRLSDSLRSIVEVRHRCRDDGSGTQSKLTKSRRMSTPHPIKSRGHTISNCKSIGSQAAMVRSHSMPENLDKLHRKKNFLSLIGSDTLSISSHRSGDDSSDESEYSVDFTSLQEKSQSTRSSQVALATLDERIEEETIYAEALWDHVTMDPDELGFRAGDVIRVTDLEDKDWWFGVVDHSQGWFPAAFVRMRVNQCDFDDDFIFSHEEPDSESKLRPQTTFIGKTQGRTNVINEIIQAERDYVKHLRDVVEGYLKQARKRPEMFPESKISVIFGNLEEIHTFANRFLTHLEKHINKDAPHTSEIGQCFLIHSKGFEIYSDYCNNHPGAGDELKELYRVKKFRHFFEACRLLQDMMEIPLEGFLLTPVQKICKYHLQLAELLKYTQPEHPDYDHVKAAVNAMKNIALLINERKRKMESIEKMAIWQSTVVDWEGPDILEASSELIYSGDLMKINSNGWSQERYFFLFDHQLVYCKKDLLKKKSFGYRGRIYLDHVEVIPVEDGKDSQYNVTVRNAWKIHETRRDKWYLLVAKTTQIKQRWLKAFQDERRRVREDLENDFNIPAHVKQRAINHLKQKNNPKPKAKHKATRSTSLRHSKKKEPVLPAQFPMPSPRSLLRQPHSLDNINQSKKLTWFFLGGSKPEK